MRALPLGLLLLGACSIGTPGGPDLPIDAPLPIDGYVCDPMAPLGLPGPATDPNGGLNHHVGEDCMACHQTGVEGAKIFSIAGTLYDGPSGNNPVPGATIFVHDASGQQFRMHTAANGNFYTAAQVMLPLMGGELMGAKATECPKTRTMQGSSLGSCNAAGCHSAADAQGRVYLQL